MTEKTAVSQWAGIAFDVDANLERKVAHPTESGGKILWARWYSLANILENGLPEFPQGLWAMLNAESAPACETATR